MLVSFHCLCSFSEISELWSDIFSAEQHFSFPPRMEVPEKWLPDEYGPLMPCQCDFAASNAGCGFSRRQANRVSLTEKFSSNCLDSRSPQRRIHASTALPLQHTSGVPPAPHGCKWDLLRESLALCLIHGLFSKIQLSVNVGRSFRNFLWRLSKNGLYEVWTIWWAQLTARCWSGSAPGG